LADWHDKAATVLVASFALAPSSRYASKRTHDKEPSERNNDPVIKISDEKFRKFLVQPLVPFSRNCLRYLTSIVK